MAKIRVMCSDPFATDPSSDDESVEDGNTTPSKKKKRFIQEISASIPPSTPVSTIHLDYLARLKSDSSSRKDESKSEVEEEKVPRNCIVLALPALKPGEIPRKKPGISRIQNILKMLSLAKKSSSGNCVNQIAKSRRKGASEHPGLRLTATGRWGVKIRHPLRKTQVGLGTYDTFDEASKVHNEKKLEFGSLKCARPEREKRPGEKISNKREWKRLVVEGVTVLETPSGKWEAFIAYPIEKRKVWLGSYLTPEEAMEAYKRKKLEFDSTSNWDCIEKDSSMQVKVGTCIPAMSKRLASDSASNRNSIEKDSSMQVDARIPVKSKKLRFDSTSNRDGINKDSSMQINACVPVRSKKLNCPGVKLNTSGRWEVTIQHPIWGCILHLGSYSTFELAAEAYDKIKSKLDTLHRNAKAECLAAEMAENEETQTQIGSAEKKYKGVRATSSGKWSARINGPFRGRKTVDLGVFNTPEEAADAFKMKRREFDVMRLLVKKRKQERNAKIVKKAKPKYKKLDAIDAENSTLTVVNSQDSGGSNNKNDENQTPSFSLVSEHLYEGVIDSYGRLVGEYSKIDDELWFDRPGGDDGAIGGTEDPVWDQKPSSAVLMNAGILLNDDKAGIY